MSDSWQKPVWAEGVILGQQHFQRWDSYYQKEQEFLFDALGFAPFLWGVISLELDSQLLVSGKFLLKKCIARLPGGMMVNFDSRSGNLLSCNLDNSCQVNV
ncbi:MAG: type VI secretion system baseplate subunit TssK [Gammaproteobacteria bacterium]|nr:type VI secretion system baseplate subunit TssK [Gammaproteobacteria bacterium]